MLGVMGSSRFLFFGGDGGFLVDLYVVFNWVAGSAGFSELMSYVVVE
jgi:hypothetical protein